MHTCCLPLLPGENLIQNITWILWNEEAVWSDSKTPNQPHCHGKIQRDCSPNGVRRNDRACYSFVAEIDRLFYAYWFASCVCVIVQACVLGVVVEQQIISEHVRYGLVLIFMANLLLYVAQDLH